MTQQSKRRKRYCIIKYQRVKSGKTLQQRILYEYRRAPKIYRDLDWRILLQVKVIDKCGDDLIELREDMDMPTWRFKGSTLETWDNICVTADILKEMEDVEDEESARLIFEVGDD